MAGSNRLNEGKTVNHLKRNLLSVVILALALCVLAGCPVRDVLNVDNTNGNGATVGDDATNSGNANGVVPADNTNTNSAPDDANPPVNQNANASSQTNTNTNANDNGSSLGNQSTDPADNGNQSGNGSGGQDDSSGGGPPPGGGSPPGGGTPPDDGGPPPGDDGQTTPPSPCTAEFIGFGTNPGAGSGDTFVPDLEFDGPSGAFVTINPVIPIFGGTSLNITPNSVGRVTFECADQAFFGAVVFDDGNGNTTSPGDVTLLRGTDFACGQPMTIRFSLPCKIELVP